MGRLKLTVQLPVPFSGMQLVTAQQGGKRDRAICHSNRRPVHPLLRLRLRWNDVHCVTLPRHLSNARADDVIGMTINAMGAAYLIRSHSRHGGAA